MMSSFFESSTTGYGIWNAYTPSKDNMANGRYNPPMPSRRTEFINGIKASLPVLLGVVPFAMISGVTAVNINLTPIEGIGMSLIVFAGAAQLVALQLISTNTPILIILVSTFFINLRFFIYSASLAPHLQQHSARERMPLAYLLTDQAYAISIVSYNQGGQDGQDKQNVKRPFRSWFYIGSGFILWLVWQSSTIVGVLVGAQIPASWSLDFSIPLTFMALIFMSLNDRPTVLAAMSAGVTAVIAKPLPYNLGMILAALIGIAAGFFASRSTKTD